MAFGSLIWYVGYQPLTIGHFLDFTRHVASVHNQPVDLDHPSHWVLVYLARQSPVGVHLEDVEHVHNLD